MRTQRFHIALWLLSLYMLCACSVDKFIGDDELYLKKVEVTSTDKKTTKPYALPSYVRQTPNSKWFGSKVPLHIYTLSKPQSNKWTSRLLRKIGEAPVIVDTLLTANTASDMQQVLANAGYIHSQVEPQPRIKDKKLTLNYVVTPGERYYIHNIQRNIADSTLHTILCGTDTAASLINNGMPFDINRLNDERTRITTFLRNNGYYKFNKEYITYVADTISGSNQVDLTLTIPLYLENSTATPAPHTPYYIGNITYSGDTKHFRSNVLAANTYLCSGQLYSENKTRQTYNNFTRLQAISYSNIRLTQRQTSDTLDCDIAIHRAQPRTVSFDLEGTNSAGDLGAAASASIQNRNLLRGSEVFTFKLRGAYEAITGLEGYEGQGSYVELGGELRLQFPTFLLPFASSQFGARHLATSEISLQYNHQDRPEFNRRVLTAAWRYRWQGTRRHDQHRFDLLEINYINMPWISPRFRQQYLDAIGQQNAILRYNYEDLLITKIGYTYTYNSLGNNTVTTYGKNAYTIRANVETSGNALHALTHLYDAPRNEQNQRTFCGIAYAQYVRADFDWAKSLRIDRNNSLALHAAFGVAIPYGNSNLLPFEKRYFAGGANSVRGWSVRSLGPGAYKGADQQINFLNQSGDVKLDLSLEYRTHLFWKLNGALFVDAGNIWTIRSYHDQPEGEFRFDTFYRQIAVGYGLGLRLALDFFILRFDGGMKAINPAYTGRAHYPFIHPDFSRDFAFHFAIGLPF